MAKPGQMRNIENPTLGLDTALSNVRSVASGSNQTPETTQTASMDPNRLAARTGPTRDTAGRAEVERDGVMENQTSDQSSSQRTIDAKRKRIYG